MPIPLSSSNTQPAEGHRVVPQASFPNVVAAVSTSPLSTRCRSAVALKQTASLLTPLENDMGGRRSCATICFPLIVPPVQVEAELSVMDRSVARAEPGSGSGQEQSRVKSHVWLNWLKNPGFLRNPPPSPFLCLCVRMTNDTLADAVP